MSLHKEIHLESEVCDYLAQHGWLYEAGPNPGYDVALALFLPDLQAWLAASQPKQWEALCKYKGTADQAGRYVAECLRKHCNQHGTLEALRGGLELMGASGKLQLAQFRPAMPGNAEIERRYGLNRLRVLRQVRYSAHSGSSLDLVLCLNGLPVATAELKSDFTQSVHDAMDQYKHDRKPGGGGQPVEPLLSFPGGALVHFAVSGQEVRMTTRLEGPHTRFLPFNLGNGGGKGNPPNPDGHSTAYLWQDVWQPDQWLGLLGRYMTAVRDDKKKLTGWIFPRFHQLDATRKLLADVLDKGPGQKYLIQHSAGSGKTNSIAWTAHFLADLHNAQGHKIFDTVVVVSDRTVIDNMLHDAIFSFERIVGVVATIKGHDGSKSGELATALAGGKKIVVCTIQTFPFALAEVQSLAATQGRTFAVIADEAHSSQAGEAARKLKAVLSEQEAHELDDGGEVSIEDILLSQMQAARSPITFVAFTATPKTKTLELFGTRPDATRPPAADNLPRAFHVYSMRQAIEEGFILDVLQNYTSYKTAFALAQSGTALSELEVERSEAKRRIMGWVRLHDYNIAQKVQLVVEHFRRHVSPLLGGRAKAMVVVASRLEAVRWQLALHKYIIAQGYPLRSLVAFSGEVSDPESDPGKLTERSPLLNPHIGKSDFRKAFDTDSYQILLVANKFQTGFDQPLLCGMYVDKLLSGIAAVQTLSRLNRAHPGKDTTFVVDFVNQPEQILTAFQTYYETASLTDTTDPNLVFTLKTKLDAAALYDQTAIDAVVHVMLSPTGKQGQLAALLTPIAQHIMTAYSQARETWRKAEQNGDAAGRDAAKQVWEALVQFRGDMVAYRRLYTFLSQVWDLGNTELEKRSIFYHLLIPLLDFERERSKVDLASLRLTHHGIKQKSDGSLDLVHDLPIGLPPITAVGTGAIHDKDKALFAEIIAMLNQLFEGELTDDDKLVYVHNVLMGKLLESETLQKQAANNTEAQFSTSTDIDTAMVEAIIDALDAHQSMSQQALGSELVRRGLKEILLGHGKLWERLRERRAA
jgi:type I restriction enzyme R subunit